MYNKQSKTIITDLCLEPSPLGAASIGWRTYMHLHESQWCCLATQIGEPMGKLPQRSSRNRTELLQKNIQQSQLPMLSHIKGYIAQNSY